MAMVNPTTRANYEPNSWGPEVGGPREDPERGYTTFPAPASGEKRRLRPESFADHYSQARQFYVSQNPVEQKHIINAFVFELSKCERPEIRARMVGGLRNVDEDLAASVAAGLGLELPEKIKPAREPIAGLPPSPALSIIVNGPGSLAGRKLGVLITDGADVGLLDQLRTAAEAEQVVVEIVAPTVGGVTGSDGKLIAADQKIDGGPSVLYDAVAILTSAEGVETLAGHPAARDFVTDAYAHAKFVGYTAAANSLLAAVGLADRLDDGFIALDDVDPANFLGRCAPLRYWDRQLPTT
jgi:catalase